MQDVFIGRQPIYGRNLDVFAYELLFRGGDVDYADFTEGDRATSKVILNAFTEIGLERVVGQRLAFLNLTRSFIVGEYPLPVPSERVVLEVLEDVEPDDEVLEGLWRLKEEGFRIALDDFILTKATEPFLALADIVKVESPGSDPDELRALLEPLRSSGAKLVAEKIETQEEFNVCRELGFDYFQGFFLCRPNVLRDRALPPNRINLLRILAEVQDPACEFDELHEMISHDVALSYKLLRHINGVTMGLRRTIESVRETVLYLGQKNVKNLTSLYLLASIDDKPRELMVTAMLRGKMCELLGRAEGSMDRHQAFTVGLFSVLEALLDCPMKAILERLPLIDATRAALLDQSGTLGQMLRTTLAYERGDWDLVACPGLTRGQIKAAFLGAVDWVEEVDRELLGEAA